MDEQPESVEKVLYKNSFYQSTLLKFIFIGLLFKIEMSSINIWM